MLTGFISPADEVPNNVKEAKDNLIHIQAQPLSRFANGPYFGVATAIFWAASPQLDRWTNFFTGWADGLTAGWWSGLVGQTGLLSQVNVNSLEYGAGKIVGVVHGLTLAVLLGGACQAGWAKTFGTYLTWSSTAWSMYDATNKVFAGTATVWDYLAYLPAAGYVAGWLNRACFVGETEVAVGWGSVHDASAALLLAGESTDTASCWLEDWTLECIFVGTGILLLTAVYTRKRTAQQEELDHLFATVPKVAGTFSHRISSHAIADSPESKANVRREPDGYSSNVTQPDDLPFTSGLTPTVRHRDF